MTARKPPWHITSRTSPEAYEQFWTRVNERKNGPIPKLFWDDAYIDAARRAYPSITRNKKLAVGWKITNLDGTTGGLRPIYYWPMVNGDFDAPVLHDTRKNWCESNNGQCPRERGDGFCLSPAGYAHVQSGGVLLKKCLGHVLVYPVELARPRFGTTFPLPNDVNNKIRAPWVIDVDTFDPLDPSILELAPIIDVFVDLEPVSRKVGGIIRNISWLSRETATWTATFKDVLFINVKFPNLDSCLFQNCMFIDCNFDGNVNHVVFLNPLWSGKKPGLLEGRTLKGGTMPDSMRAALLRRRWNGRKWVR